MTHRKRLTADGPQAAYSRLITHASSGKDTRSGIGQTPPERPYVERPYIENIDSEGESNHHRRRGAQNLVLSQARARPERPYVERPHIKNIDSEGESNHHRRRGAKNLVLLQARARPKSTERPQSEQARARTRARTESTERPCRDSLGEQGEPEAQPKPQQPTTAYNKLYMDSLKRQVKDQSETITLLQKAQTLFLHQSRELPRFCRWECISKVLTDIVSLTLLGLGLTSHLYPSEDELIPKILGAFNVQMDMQEEVELFLTEWGKGGKINIQMRVSDNIRDRRGSILRTLREEFYLQIGLPRPRKTEAEESRLAWKQRLMTLRQGHAWCIKHDKDSMDPWGSRAVHHSIAKVLFGVRYDTEAPLNINLKQAGFFFHNLELAIDGDVMETGRMLYHLRKMSEMEERIKIQFLKDMKRIVVIS